MDDGAFWILHISVDEIIGKTQETGDEGSIGFDASVSNGFPAAANGQLFREETTFCPVWNDVRILDLLGFYKPEDFGSKIISPV